MKLDFTNYDSRFSQFFNRILELVLLNFVFILTCILIITIGASVTVLYSITLKMIRKEEGYIIRGYFQAFARNFRQAALLWIARPAPIIQRGFYSGTPFIATCVR